MLDEKDQEYFDLSGAASIFVVSHATIERLMRYFFEARIRSLHRKLGFCPARSARGAICAVSSDYNGIQLDLRG